MHSARPAHPAAVLRELLYQRAVALPTAAQVILPAKLGAGVRLLNVLLPIMSVLLSMAIGAFGGLLMGVVTCVHLCFQVFSGNARQLGQSGG